MAYLKVLNAFQSGKLCTFLDICRCSEMLEAKRFALCSSILIGGQASGSSIVGLYVFIETNDLEEEMCHDGLDLY